MSYRYDSELATVVPLLTPTDLTDVLAARQQLEEMVEQSAPMDRSDLETTDHVVGGFQGDPDVNVRVYRPSDASGIVPALLYVHGGGFVVGSILAEQENAATLASELGIVVASVGYRLAPEHPFPAALHDCVASLQWIFQSVEQLGVDPARVGVYGSSAGGGLAAALALYCRDHGGPRLCFQFLAIPVLDDRLETQSMRTFLDTPEWNRPSAELSWRYYLGADGSASVSSYAAPARADDLRNLPPAYVSTMEFDPLRDEGILYALALLDAGVPVELHSFPGTFHGSSTVKEAAVSKRMHVEQVRVLRRALGVSGSD
jgi:acetyl esterase